MLTFTHAISCFTASNLPWLMELTFQVSMQYCSLQHWTLLLSPVTSATGYCFCFGFFPSFFLKLFLHWSPVAYWEHWPGEFLFHYPIILHFNTVHVVLKAGILKWFAIPFSSGPHSVRPLHRDLSVWCGSTLHGLSVCADRLPKDECDMSKKWKILYSQQVIAIFFPCSNGKEKESFVFFYFG